MCHGHNEKGKRETTKGIELLNQENIRTLGKKEKFKNLRTFEVVTIKQIEMKEKIKKFTWKEQENET